MRERERERERGGEGERDPPTKKFNGPLKTNKLKTFSNMCKKKMVKSNGRVTIYFEGR